MRKQIKKFNGQIDDEAIKKLFKAASAAEKKNQVESFFKRFANCERTVDVGTAFIDC